MAVQYSTQSVVSDGTLSTIVLGIKYVLRANIYLRIDGVETPQTGAPSGYTWSFLDATTIRVLPVVPTGITVEVYRRTDITGMYNVFSQNAQFDEGTIDENNTQLLYIAQEYLEQDLTGVGIASLEYVRSEPGYEIYRFQRSDGTYFPEFPVPTDTAALETHKLSTNQHPLSGVTGLLDELSQLSARIDTNADPVLDVRWLSKRSPMRTGYTAADGQTLPRSLYPDALAAIQAGLVPVCTEAEWLADPAKRGCFTLGDGTTTFRVPDYNGMQPGSYGPVYLGGGNTAGGAVLRDRIQDLAGEFELIGTTTSGASWGVGIPDPTAVGVFAHDGVNLSHQVGSHTANSSLTSKRTRFDASRVARTGDTTRPITAEGCLAIKLFGAVQNAGSADAAALATAVADLAARMSVVEGKVATLEQRKSTCLVNATGTGAPHETVATQLPANIAINSRYVIPNPFGNNTPVICWAEVFANGVWSNAGWIYSAGGYGTEASYVQGVGVVIQTGGTAIATLSNNSGGGHGINTNVVSAPCRVFVRKLEA